MKKEVTPPPGKMAVVGTLVFLTLCIAVWSVIRTVKANDRTVYPPTASDILKSIQSADRQIEEVQRDPNMSESTRQRVIGMIRGGKGRLEGQYNKLKAGEQLTR